LKRKEERRSLIARFYDPAAPDNCPEKKKKVNPLRICKRGGKRKEGGVPFGGRGRGCNRCGSRGKRGGAHKGKKKKKKGEKDPILALCAKKK